MKEEEEWAEDEEEDEGEDGGEEEEEWEPENGGGGGGERFSPRSKLIVLIVLAVTLVLAAVGYFAFFRKASLPGSQLMTAYKELYDQKKPRDLKNKAARHMLVVKAVADGNVPSHFGSFETIKVKGKKGTEVEFEISRSGLRIGNDENYVEIPLDGPHAAAAAEIYCNCTLPTYWMIQQVDKQAMKIKGGIAQKGKGKVRFFASPDIARELEIDWQPNNPDGLKAMSPEFIQVRNDLLKDWRKQHKISDDQLTAGYFKEIVQPIDNLTCGHGAKRSCTGSMGWLEIYGGYDEEGQLIQDISAGFHEAAFFDYAQLPRFTRKTLRVNGAEMPLNEFSDSNKYAKEFGFQRTKIHEPPYAYSDELKKFVEENK